MNALHNKIQLVVIDAKPRALSYRWWVEEKSRGCMQVIGWGDTTQEAAALLQHKPDCVLYNPWSLFMADPTDALITHQWGDYTGMCYGVEYLATIQQLSPKTTVLICTEDLDCEFVLEQGQRFKNFSGYLHSWNMDVVAVVARVMQGDVVAYKAPRGYYPNLKDAESFEALCQQTDLLALAAHQRRSPQHIYYSLLSTMECLKVRSFAECNAYVLSA